MEQSTVALIIAAIMALLFVTEKIPLAVTAMLAALAMYFTGILSFTEAMTGFTSSAVILLIGMMIMGIAFEQVGLADRLSALVMKLSGTNEKKFAVIIIIITAVTASFLVSLVVVTVMMGIVNRAVENSDGRLTRKSIYMPLAISAIYGSTITSISATSIMTASSMLQDSGYGRGFGFLEPGILSIPVLVISVLAYVTFGYGYANKCFDFIEQQTDGVRESNAVDVPAWKTWLTAGVMATCILCFIFTDLNIGAVSLTGALILIVFGCIDDKTAFRKINWSVVLLVVGSLGFAKGMFVSGAGQVIAEAVMRLFGSLGQSPYAMCIVFMCLAVILTNFISNNATVTIILPIALMVAKSLGVDGISYALAVSVGANLSVCTPIACANISMTTVVGYRMKDYLRVGGMFNIIAVVVVSLMLRIVYFT
ncbi:MAG: SLC13 family permease [Eubacteriales bacterium]|nr:SLC13 family permease [Eubacteriales bacterium]